MKKIIIPALLSIVLVSSCSQALYKNSYDWVKVAPKNKSVVRDTLPTEVKSELMNPEEIIVTKIKDVVVNRKDTATIHGVSNHEPVSSVQPMLNQKETDIVEVRQIEQDAQIITEKENGASKQFDPAKRASSNLSNEDRGYIAAAIGLGILLILMLIFGAGPFIKALVIFITIFYPILQIVAVGMAIFGVCWLFWKFLFMFD